VTVGVFLNHRKSNELDLTRYSLRRKQIVPNTNNPSDGHWTTLLRVVGYVSNTKEYALRYEKYSPILEGYSDTNWIADSEKSKSTSEYIVTLEGATVYWKSSKQTCIAHSTKKSKFIALNKAGEEAKWLR